MGLQITFTDSFNVTHADSYHNIRLGVYCHQDKYQEIFVRIYKDKATRDADLSNFIAGKEILIVPSKADFDIYFADIVLRQDSTNSMIKGYEYLKTLTIPFDYLNSSSEVTE